MKKLRDSILVLLLVGAAGTCIWLYFFLFGMSAEMAEIHEELSGMQYPVLFLTYVMTTADLSAIVTGLYLVLMRRRGMAVADRCTGLLRFMGHSFLAAGLSSGSILVYGAIYARSNLGMPGSYILMASLVHIMAALFLYFLSDFFLPE